MFSAFSNFSGLGAVSRRTLAQRIRQLFSNNEQGVWYDPSDFSTMFQDSAGTTPVTAVEQPVGKMLDKSGRGNHATQATSTKRPVLSAKVNLLTGSAALATQSVTTAAIPYTLKQTGTGTITLSGTSTAGPLVGPGTLTFTPTAGTLTLTVSGSVTDAQLETGSVATRYQWVNTAVDYDTVGFNKYLKFDGVDDALVTGSINFTAGDKMTVVAGVRKPDDASFKMIFELSGNTDSSNGAFNSVSSHLFPSVKGSYFSSGVRGSTPASYISTGAVYPAPISAIQTILLNIAIDTQIIRINGTQAASGVADLGTGNFGYYPLYIGSRAGTSLPFNGNIYSLIIRGAASTDAQIAAAEAFCNQKTGAY